MQKLTDLAIKILFGRLIQRPVEEMEDDRLRNTLELMNYFDEESAGPWFSSAYHFLWPSPTLNKLPRNVREDMLEKLTSPSFWDGSVRWPEAWDVALFVHEEQEVLRLGFMSPNFDLDFFLRVCGHKLKNLIALELPVGCTLTAKTCRRMCRALPKLSRLNISNTVVEEDAATYIARLPLVVFYADGTNEDFVRKVSVKSSPLRRNLEIFKLSNDLPLDCYRTILKRMKSIELLITEGDSRWLKALRPKRRSPLRQYNLRTLVLMYPHDDFEEELKIGALTCPKVSKIEITPNVFTLKMLQSLMRFKELRDLVVDLRYDSDVELAEENDDFDRVCLRDFRFDKLVNFVLYDENDRWVSCGYLCEVLAMCPSLDNLVLLNCSGFSNKTAHEVADLMAAKSARVASAAVNFLVRWLRFPSRIASPALTTNTLKRLEIVDCNLLGPSGIEELLKIDSLKVLEVSLRIDEMRRQHFDIGAMKRMADKRGVALVLQFLPWVEDEN